jgi:hypothetical protein
MSRLMLTENELAFRLTPDVPRLIAFSARLGGRTYCYQSFTRRPAYQCNSQNHTNDDNDRERGAATTQAEERPHPTALPVSTARYGGGSHIPWTIACRARLCATSAVCLYCAVEARLPPTTWSGSGPRALYALAPSPAGTARSFSPYWGWVGNRYRSRDQGDAFGKARVTTRRGMCSGCTGHHRRFATFYSIGQWRCMLDIDVLGCVV